VTGPAATLGASEEHPARGGEYDSAIRLDLLVDGDEKSTAAAPSMPGIAIAAMSRLQRQCRRFGRPSAVDSQLPISMVEESVPRHPYTLPFGRAAALAALTMFLLANFLPIGVT
jgi:hypothetical protein